MAEISSLQTLAIGGAIVGFNAMVSAVAVSFANWWTQRAIRKLDQAAKAENAAAGPLPPKCSCVGCPVFDKCRGKAAS